MTARMMIGDHLAHFPGRAPYVIKPGLAYDPEDHADAWGIPITFEPCVVSGFVTWTGDGGDLLEDTMPHTFGAGFPPASGARPDGLRIVLDPRLLAAEMRSTLAHELVHVERGPFPACGRRTEEREVSAIAAGRLLPLDELLEAARGADSVEDVAERQNVRSGDVLVRLESLTNAEHERFLRAVTPGRHPVSRLRRRCGSW